MNSATNTPHSSASAASTPSLHVRGDRVPRIVVHAVTIAALALVMLFALWSVALFTRPIVDVYFQAYLQTEADVAEAQRAQVRLLQDQLEALKALHEIAVPPNNDKLFTILSKGVGAAEDIIRSTTVDLVPAAAFATDLTTAQQTDAFTQEVTILNTEAMTSGTKNLCYKAIAWTAAGANCTAKCAAQAITCTGGGTATDGFPLLPGQAVSRRYDGTVCLCVVGSAASTDFFSERVIR